MRKYLFLLAAALLCGGCSCSSKSETEEKAEDQPVQKDIPMKEVQVGSKTYNVADIDDQMALYKENVDRDNCFIVISKKEYRLYVYEVAGQDTLLVAHFPVCYGKNPGPKQGTGDMSTPECTMDEPFCISEIKDASTWCHDFGDGRGQILSYGAYFMRLVTPGFSGIGIHGSTNNEASVPGRDSEGCIRLRDNDLLRLHDLYAEVDMPVVIKGIKENKLPFEVKAEQKLGDQYKAPKDGNPIK